MTDPRSKGIPIFYEDGDCGTITAGKAENARLTADLTQDGLKWRRLGPRVVKLLKAIEFSDHDVVLCNGARLCPKCHGNVHASRCELAALLREAEA